MKLLEKLETYKKINIFLLGLSQIVFLGIIDYLSGYEISFSFFYLIPVAFMAWFADKKIGFFSGFVSAIVWQFVNIEAGEIFSSKWIYVWNTSTRLGFFIVVTILLTKLKTSFIHEKTLARTDHLTGAANPRAFYETAKLEIDRAKRYRRPMTICYFDIDNFKQINDTLGHHVGSDLLVKVVETIKQNLRSTDVIARVGGDEFAILLPETNQEQARIVANKLHDKLQTVMDEENWAVTFSIGVLTCIKVPKTVDELIRQADSLMYEVKKNGKNSVNFKELDHQPSTMVKQKQVLSSML